MNSLAFSRSWVSEQLKRLADPYFWVPFIPIVIVKLVIFHFAASGYLFYGHQPTFGMDYNAIEPYSDFTYYYMTFVRLFLQGNMPYTDALWVPDGIQVHIYTPVFLYITTGFSFIPSEVLYPDIQSAALALGRDLDFLRVGFSFVVFDLATCVVMYAIARKLTKNRMIPVVVLLVYALNPISIWWGNYLWLSTPIHTFFLTLGFYFMIRGDLRWAAFWVTVATMIKQTAGLLLPVILFLEYGRSTKRAIISFGIMATVFLAFSMPYLVLIPTNYLSAITAGTGPYWFFETLPAYTHPVPVSVLAFYLHEPLKLFFILLVYYGIPFAVFLALFWISAASLNQTSQSIYQKQLVTLALLLSLAMHLFLPRGIYKYYLIALLPFLILFGTILRGPLIPQTPTTSVPETISQKIFQRIPPQSHGLLHEFAWRAHVVINNVATWWFALVVLASIALFVVDRLLAPAITLTLFLILLIYAGYRYQWKSRQQKRNKLPESNEAISESS